MKILQVSGATMISVVKVIIALCVLCFSATGTAQSPCYGVQPHIEQRTCLQNELDKSVEVLLSLENKTRKLLLGWDQEPEFRARANSTFEISIKSFYEYRDNYCEFQASLSSGGNSQEDRRLSCRTKLNLKEIALLRSDQKFLEANTSESAAVTSPCFTYSDEEITLQGVLSRRTFAEQPNYESIAKGDAKATYFFITPLHSFCVAEGEIKDGTEPAIGSVARVQLMFDWTDGNKPYRRLHPYLGKGVICHGSLFPAISGHHHSPVLLSDAKCAKMN